MRMIRRWRSRFWDIESAIRMSPSHLAGQTRSALPDALKGQASRGQGSPDPPAPLPDRRARLACGIRGIVQARPSQFFWPIGKYRIFSGVAIPPVDADSRTDPVQSGSKRNNSCELRRAHSLTPPGSHPIFPAQRSPAGTARQALDKLLHCYTYVDPGNSYRWGDPRKVGGPVASIYPVFRMLSLRSLTVVAGSHTLGDRS